MKVNVNNLKNKYVVFNESTSERGLIFGPITNAYLEEGEILTLESHGAWNISIQTHGDVETDEILFITRFLWKATLYSVEKGLR